MTVGETTESTTEDRPASRGRQGRPRRAGRHHDPDPARRRERHRGQARRRPARAHRAARRGPPAHRGRPRRRQDDAGQGAGAVDRLLGAPHPVHPRPAAERHHRRLDLQPGDAASSSSSPARSSPTSWSATRSTAPRRRPSRRCWSAWRSARSPSTATTYELGAPFMVIATQNPIEMEGTYPLPEAQRDRFTARVVDGLPARRRPSWRCSTCTAAPRRSTTSSRSPTPPRSRKLIDAVRDGPRRRRGQAVRVDLVTATRNSPDLRLGASPRATLHLLRAARAARRARRPRLRAARRPPGARRRRCSRTGCCPPPRRRSAGAPPRTSWPTSCRGCRCPTTHAPGGGATR